jgi:hypothetical protein
MARPSRNQDITSLLQGWEFDPSQPLVRRIQAEDGRDLLQMRVDLGLLQLETTGRPDGEKPEGFSTYYDFLVSAAFHEGPDFALDAARQVEVDREFFQFYHRRICWLKLSEYGLAALDAEHSLRLMDFSTANATDREWALMHEQYRPFVMFHGVQATALTKLEADDPEAAVAVIDGGLDGLQAIFVQHDAAEQFDEDVFVVKLREMRESIKSQFHLGPSLAEQLKQAIAAEQYELAAKLRDRLANSGREPGV